MEARETDSPTPPLLNHMNNVDYIKDEIKDKNLFNNEDNHVKIEGSLARYVSKCCLLLCKSCCLCYCLAEHCYIYSVVLW